jgi:small subunit ribosomal protein S6
VTAITASGPHDKRGDDMSRTYELMYLLDNNAVRAGWKEAKASALASIEKHGGKVLSARRWEERRLAYPVRRRRRGTYLLIHAELEPGEITPLRRELDISESVLRYLILQVEAVPPQEIELTQAEAATDFVVPMPPPDDVLESDEDEGVEQRSGEASASDDSDSDDSDGDTEDSDEDSGPKAKKRSGEPAAEEV